LVRQVTQAQQAQQGLLEQQALVVLQVQQVMHQLLLGQQGQLVQAELGLVQSQALMSVAEQLA
jgi:hypothetical protein